MIVVKESYGYIEYDETVPAVIGHFDAFMKSEQFRVFLNKGLDFLLKMINETGSEVLWLADTRKHAVQPNEDTRWVSEVWNPRAYKGGLRHVAFVMPEKIFAQASVDNYAKHNDQQKEGQMQIKMFDSVEKAKAWFKEVKSKTTA